MSAIAVTVADDDESQNNVRRPAGATLGGGDRSKKNRTVMVDTDKLSASVHSLSSDLSKIFKSVATVDGAKLKTVTVSIEVSAEGGVSLIGSMTAGIRGAIDLEFEL